MDVASMIAGAIALIVLGLNVLYIATSSDDENGFGAGMMVLAITVITTVIITMQFTLGGR